MAHPRSTRDKVRRLYCNDQLSLDSAAKMCDVSLGTARRWRDDAKKQGDDWDKLRAAHTLAGGNIEEIARGMLATFLVQYRETMQHLQTDPELDAQKRVTLLASLGDSYTKMVAANKRILPETSRLAMALEIIEMLTEFVQQRYPKHLIALVEVLEPFGVEIEKKLG